jgi:hypothetical protein
MELRGLVDVGSEVTPGRPFPWDLDLVISSAPRAPGMRSDLLLLTRELGVRGY